jgi:PAS domain S-box-containing protein
MALLPTQSQPEDSADSEGRPRYSARVGPDQLLALIDHTSAVIYMRDLQGKYMLINRQYERLFGVRREDVIGLSDHDLFPADVADQFYANDLFAARSGGPVQMEETVPDPDGPRTYVTIKFPLLDDAEQPYAICGISTDITDRKRAEQEVADLNADLERRVAERTAELEATTRELDAFAYSVSHDLRAPLRSLNGFSQMLLDDYSDRLDETGVSHLHRLQANTVRMAQLIEDLLRLSQTTRAELRRQRMDLGELAALIRQELEAAEPEQQIEILVDGPLTAMADRHLMKLALHNLLANAWKFSSREARGQIQFGTLLTGPNGVFFVRDNGVGFDPRYAGRLFEPFQRLHEQSDFEGSGIGLAIVYRVIRRHGGAIWAESMPGQGATFYFTLDPHTPVPGKEGPDA